MTGDAPTTAAIPGDWAGPALLVPIAVDAVLLTAGSYDGIWSWIEPETRRVDVLIIAPDQHLFENVAPAPIDPHGNSKP